MSAAMLRGWWRSLAARERTLLAAGAALVGLALFWWIALAPALGTLRAAQDQHRTLDAQLQQMQRLQAQAQAMQAQPRPNPDDSLRQLEQAIRQQLGTVARYSVSGERVTVTLAGAPSPALARWLAQARTDARALPGEARLTRNAAGHWDGTLVLTLPAR
jgi:general secretion pathway protein M